MRCTMQKPEYGLLCVPSCKSNITPGFCTVGVVPWLCLEPAGNDSYLDAVRPSGW
jgi:hypothetical protein